MIKIAICDDEQCFYDSIHRYINGYMSHRREEYEVNIFSSGEELLGKMEALREYTIICDMYPESWTHIYELG